jgi:hypothetical protein
MKYRGDVLYVCYFMYEAQYSRYGTKWPRRQNLMVNKVGVHYRMLCYHLLCDTCCESLTCSHAS